MDLTSDKSREHSVWIAQLHEPTRLRWALTGAMLIVGIGIHVALASHNEDLARRLAAEQNRDQLVQQIDVLRDRMDAYRNRVSHKADVNEWTQYLLQQLRQSPLKLVSLEPGKPRRSGPYQLVVIEFEVEGRFDDLDDFLHWVETDQRLFRLEKFVLVPSRSRVGALTMQLTITGMAG